MTDYERDANRQLPKREVLAILARIGFAEETIAEISPRLPDPVNLHDAADMLQAYGLTRDALISRLGGSP